MGYVDPHVVILSETCLRQKQDANPNRDHREWMSHVIPLMETLLLETLTVTDDQWNVERPDLVPWLCGLRALSLGQLE